MSGPSTPTIERVDGRGRLELHAGRRRLVGRAPEAELRLEFREVSSRHAWFHNDGAGTWIVDAGSTNGTTVNDRPLAPYRHERLFDGDRIRLGTVPLVYRDRR